MSDASVAQIETELKELWKQTAESTQEEGQHAVMRTCVMNLIAYARDPSSGNEVSSQLSEVAAQHPARTIIVIPNFEAQEPMLDAVVSAFCSIYGGSRKQVCCEQILLRAQGDRLHQVPSLVRPLLIPDLPTVLWWRDQIPFEDSLFDDFLNTADRVILDSARLPRPVEQLGQIAALVQKERQWTAFSDLNWARLNPWRLSMARLFDVPDYRSSLFSINRIDITGFDPARNSASTQALFLVSWLASRLKWTAVSRAQVTPGSWDANFHTGESTLQVRIVSGSGTYNGISGIRLSADHAQFEISIAESAAHLETRTAIEGTGGTTYVTPLPSAGETHLLSKELDILGHDRVYEQALEYYLVL